MKTRRNISGIYFRTKNEETDKYENIVFEDLSESQQDELLNSNTNEWIKSLAKQLANTINSLGEAFDIVQD